MQIDHERFANKQAAANEKKSHLVFSLLPISQQFMDKACRCFIAIFLWKDGMYEKDAGKGQKDNNKK